MVFFGHGSELFTPSASRDSADSSTWRHSLSSFLNSDSYFLWAVTVRSWPWNYSTHFRDQHPAYLFFPSSAVLPCGFSLPLSAFICLYYTHLHAVSFVTHCKQSVIFILEDDGLSTLIFPSTYFDFFPWNPVLNIWIRELHTFFLWLPSRMTFMEYSGVLPWLAYKQVVWNSPLWLRTRCMTEHSASLMRIFLRTTPLDAVLLRLWLNFILWTHKIKSG